MSAGPPRVWVLIDDRPGNSGQSLGVADALGWPYEQKTVVYDRLAAMPALMRGALIGVRAESRALLRPPFPDLVIAAGRRLAPVAIRIKKASHGRTFLCQIMDPGRSLWREFNLLAIPEHDGEVGARPNIVRVTGAPHRVTAAWLDAARARFAQAFESMAAPRVALIVGGATKDRAFTAGMAHTLAEAAVILAGPGTVMASTSRRTGEAAEAALAAVLPDTAFLYRFGDDGDNPYPGLLAWADAIVVTGDSVSMCSEACGTGKPVHIFAPEGFLSAKHDRLVESLIRTGAAARLGEAPPPGGEIVDAAGVIADAIRDRLQVR